MLHLTITGPRIFALLFALYPVIEMCIRDRDYIENPVKTDEKILVSSFACSYETADIEFELLLSQAMQKGNRCV